MRHPLIPLALAILALPGVARAELPQVTLGPSLSTLGVGAELGLRFNDWVGARLGGNWFAFGFKRGFEDVDYDVDLNLGSIGTVLDVHPFGGGFRITGGLRFNFNDATLAARPGESVQIGETTYTPEEIGRLRGSVDFNTFSPYLGLGYGGTLLDGALELAFDLGAMYHGRPQVGLRAVDGLLAGDPAFQADVEAERQRIADDLSGLRVYPVAGLSLVYRF